MPISYSIDHERSVIVETWTGDVDATELGDYWRRMLADPDAQAIRRTLVDLRHCTVLFTGSQLSDLVRGIAEPRLSGKQWKTAIIVDQPVQFGISRQYHAFAESFSNDAIFDDRDAALTWLLS
jgi:hypothetical protein